MRRSLRRCAPSPHSQQSIWTRTAGKGVGPTMGLSVCLLVALEEQSRWEQGRLQATDEL